MAHTRGVGLAWNGKPPVAAGVGGNGLRGAAGVDGGTGAVAVRQWQIII